MEIYYFEQEPFAFMQNYNLTGVEIEILALKSSQNLPNGLRHLME